MDGFDFTKDNTANLDLIQKKTGLNKELFIQRYKQKLFENK
jgi:hypothetical protein